MIKARFLHRSKGQSIIQYVGLLTITALFISGITIYLQRALKAGMHKAQKYAGSKMPADGVTEYEPYYIKNTANIKAKSGSVITFPGGGNDTLYTSKYDENESDFTNITCAENEQCEE